MSCDGTFNLPGWTREQDKAFESCLALYAGEPDDRWEKIAAALTGKTREEVRHHYQVLVEDLNAIASGCVPLPCYTDSAADSTNHDDDPLVCEKESQPAKPQPRNMQSSSGHARKASKVEMERRKGVAWTADEHRNFLLGLDKFGKGDWRSISRHYVRSRTATQVASHAQKYFNRLNSSNRQRRRTSIHDITTVDDGETSASQGPITGEKAGASASGSSASTKKSTKKSTPPVPPIINVDDGDTSDLVEPVTGHMNEASAVGPFTTAGMPSPSFCDPLLEPHTQMKLPSSVPAEMPSPSFCDPLLEPHTQMKLPSSVPAGMPSPSFCDPLMEPHTQMKLPSSVPGVYGFNADPFELTPADCFNECGFIDISDIPFF